MASIVKQPPITIKCSNPSKNVESITCMAVESNTKLFPIGMIWIYENTENLSKDTFMPSDHLQTTLSDTLNYFPILAGRTTEDAKGNATIHLTNEGVLYTEAECPNHTLDYFIPRTLLDEGFDYEHINTSDLAVPVSNDWTGPCMSIQVTRLKCNSVILTISAFHSLFDAQSAADFINAWASPKPLQRMPMFDKTFILYPTEEERKRISTLTRPKDCVFNRNINPSSATPFIQVQQQERVISKVYFFSTNELENLKKEASKDLPKSDDYISTYDALYAHMILVIAQATQTSLTDNIKILQSLNGRSRFVSSCSPNVLNYSGSFPFWLYGTIPSDQEPTLSSLAQLIHEMYSKQTEHSLRDYNAYLMSDDGDISKNQVDADIINRDFHCASWRKVNMLGANFGNGFPIYSGPTKQFYPRYFAMKDTHAKDGSINILLGLREQDYERMIQQNILHKYR
jgi:shikimate O-hydroxycinnamoyltransferase